MATRVFEKPVSRDMLDLQRSIAITANGNTHAAISTGQFVYVKNHSTLTDGLYVATDDIVEDGTLSSSNLTADTSGGLNALQAQIDDITGDIGTVPSGKTLQGQINANSTHIDNLQDGLAIVSDNNTHAAIASGQFVYVKNHGTLDEGMYKATAAIAQNETLSSSNLTAVADGGLNAVKSDIPAVVNDLTSDSTTSALSAAQGKALNGKIADVRDYIELGNISSKVGLDYWMSRLITDNSLSNKKKLARFSCTATFSPFVTGTSYFIDLSAASENYAAAIIQGVGTERLIQATKTPTGWSYGNNSLNIIEQSIITSNPDFNNFPAQSIVWVNNTNNSFVNAPSNSAYHVITVRTLSTHGFQIAIQYASNVMYLRTLADSAWSNWKSISFS